MVEVTTLDPSWSAIPAGLVSVQAGLQWLLAMRSALLLVPSVIVHEECAVLIKPAHPDARHITAKAVRKSEYDLLFCNRALMAVRASLAWTATMFNPRVGPNACDFIDYRRLIELIC